MSSDNSGRPVAAGGEEPYLNLVVEKVFRLDALIGIGTTGRVYRATQLGLNRQCAVKVLHRHLMLTPTVRDRFHREARLLARLTHPGIVRVLASGELPIVNADVGGEAYLVSEYLEGSTVREWLLQKGRFSLVEAIRVVLAVADAVAEAHCNRIVHRDLKPENLMSIACGNGTFRHVVLDFGLARALDREAEPLTREGA
ncbi:MAG TPA: serine/threonine-protein kinase, partial [Polyangiaceae bacterium]